MVEPNFVGGLIGGVLIGLAAVLLLLLNGRIAGISGIFGGLVLPYPARERLWRVAFIAGMLAGAGVYAKFRGMPLHLQATGIQLILAGFLVGAGTRLGAGCTSGHGVCGLARRSKRSLVATLTFMTTGIVTVFLMRHFF